MQMYFILEWEHEPGTYLLATQHYEVPEVGYSHSVLDSRGNLRQPNPDPEEYLWVHNKDIILYPIENEEGRYRLEEGAFDTIAKVILKTKLDVPKMEDKEDYDNVIKNILKQYKVI